MDNKKSLKISTEKIYKEIVKTVEMTIDKVLLSSVDKKFHDLVRYQIACGGKRLRPVFAYLACRMMGGRDKDILYPAAALEILHNYTVIIDDIIDSGVLRRGKPTVLKKFGSRVTQCAAIDYVASVFDLPGGVKNKDKIFSVFAKTLKEMTNGQILDILFEQAKAGSGSYEARNRHSQVSIEDYLKMIGGKTASLLAACFEIGGICAQANGREIKILKNIGYNLGLAFQIQDDILDILGDEKKFGKIIGKDIAEKKLGNILMLLAIAEFHPKEKEEFFKILKSGKIENADVIKEINLIKNTSAVAKAQKMVMNFINKAKNNLNDLPKNKWNEILGELINYLATRKV